MAATGYEGASGSCSPGGALTHFTAAVGSHSAARAGEYKVSRLFRVRRSSQASGMCGAGRLAVDDTKRAFSDEEACGVSALNLRAVSTSVSQDAVRREGR